jgi:hypothetical protein
MESALTFIAIILLQTGGEMTLVVQLAGCPVERLSGCSINWRTGKPENRKTGEPENNYLR